MERNSHIIVGYPDWTLLDDDCAAVHDVATEYSFTTMALRTICMPGPGALIRNVRFPPPPLRNRAFRYARGFETWLHLGLQGDFMRIPHQVAARHHFSSKPSLRADEYKRALTSLFASLHLPASMRRWRRSAYVNAALFSAWIVAPESLWKSLWLMAKAFLLNPKLALQLVLGTLSTRAAELARFSIPAAACHWLERRLEQRRARRLHSGRKNV